MVAACCPVEGGAAGVALIFYPACSMPEISALLMMVGCAMRADAMLAATLNGRNLPFAKPGRVPVDAIARSVVHAQNAMPSQLPQKKTLESLRQGASRGPCGDAWTWIDLAEGFDHHVTMPALPIVVLLNTAQPIRRMMRSSSGRIPTASTRRFTSMLRCPKGLALRSLVRRCDGNAM